MTLSISADLQSQIYAHGEQAYPEECCGIILGTIDPEKHLRVVTELIAIPNTFASPEQDEAQTANLDDTQTKKRRYLIDPKALFEAEKAARAKKIDVLGIYHSHPDHPSAASEFDRAHAMPYWSYIIASIRNGQRNTMQSWRLRDDRSQFDEESIWLEEPNQAKETQ